MTIFDWFVQGLSFGACALGAVLLFVSVTLFLIGLAGTIIHYAERGEDGEDE